jgi:F-type H+-transporting ATPase subunit epsilon
MAKFHFSLVSPERELYAGEVDQVDAPGAEGDFGVLEGHEPFMTTLRSGQVIVAIGGGARRVFEIQGGFADVTPESFTLLAEHAREVGAA